MDNRNKDKPESLQEIEDDETPINEDERIPKENGEQVDDPEEEVILADDEEIDEETGEIKKKDTAQQPQQKQQLPEEEERYRQQRREAIILSEKNKQLSDAFKKAKDVKDATDEELKQAASKDGIEWEDLSQFERVQYKKSYISDKKLAILDEVGTHVSSIEAWAAKVDTYLDENTTKQTTKALIGKEAQFREFAMKESHRGASMELLLSAFLPTVADTKKQKGSLMLTRTGGERTEKVNKLEDADYVATLRRTNQREYQRLLKAGKIKLTV